MLCELFLKLRWLSTEWAKLFYALGLTLAVGCGSIAVMLDAVEGHQRFNGFNPANPPDYVVNKYPT